MSEACSSSSPCVPSMPWFGVDVGGTLAKLVYFDPETASRSELLMPEDEEERHVVDNIRHYLLNNKSYGRSGHRDVHLQMDKVLVDGRVGSLHFIRFPTSSMHNFVELAKGKGLAKLSHTVCATGGGAHKFEKLVRDELRLKLSKFDELDALIAGLDFVENCKRDELFYFARDVNDDDEDDVNVSDDNVKSTKTSLASESEVSGWRRIALNSNKPIYPFMLVNIGSGVSILSVRARDNYQRVSGTSIGGGTFLGLCSLLTGCETFDEAMALAADGDHRKVDKLVRDIYGGDYDKFGLGGNVVASSFGNMSQKERRMDATKADLARATLVTITNNIGSLARLCARSEGIDRIVFVGNFLRVNEISMRMLANAMNFWSGSSQKALFCAHEGYFGAIGCLLELMHTDQNEDNSKQQ